MTASMLKKLMIALLGGTVILIGLAMTFLPGPAFIVIPIGLAILATEFAWARRWLKAAEAKLGLDPEETERMGWREKAKYSWRRMREKVSRRGTQRGEAGSH